jgi:hypothetical protein
MSTNTSASTRANECHKTILAKEVDNLLLLLFTTNEAG